jgi:phage FluMu protein Com
MPISFRCEHCGKKIEAPDAAGGKRGKCPYCKGSCYIPSPAAEEEVLDLAPEDDSAERKRKAELDALHRQERALIAEMTGETAGPAAEAAEASTPDDFHGAVVQYCLDLAKGDLTGAGNRVTEMRRLKRTAVAAVDDFLTGKVKEPALNAIPAPVWQGFLKQLKSELMA